MTLKIVLITIISCHVLVESVGAHDKICESRTHESLHKCDNSSSSDWTIFERCYNDAFNQISKCLDSNSSSGVSQKSSMESTKATQIGSSEGKRRSQRRASTYFDVAQKLVEQQANSDGRSSRFSTKISEELIALTFMMCNSWQKRQLQVCDRKAKHINHDYCCREASMMNCMLEKGRSKESLSDKCNSLAKGPRPAVGGEVADTAIESFRDGMKPFIECYNSSPNCSKSTPSKATQVRAAREKYQVEVDQLNVDSIVKCNDLRKKLMPKCGLTQQKSRLNCCIIQTITSCLKGLPELKKCMKILLRPFPNVAKNMEEARSLRLVKEDMRNFTFCKNITKKCETFEVRVTVLPLNDPWSDEEKMPLDISSLNSASDPNVLNSRTQTVKSQDPFGKWEDWTGVTAHAPYQTDWPIPCDQVNLIELKKCTETTTRSKPRTNSDCCVMKNVTDCLKNVPKLTLCLDSLQTNKGLTPETVNVKGVNLNHFLICSKKQFECRMSPEQTDVAFVEKIERCNELRLRVTPNCEKRISRNFNPRSRCCRVKAITECLSKKPDLQSCMSSLLSLPNGYVTNTPGAQTLKAIADSMWILVQCDKSSEQCRQIENYEKPERRPVTSLSTHSAEINDEEDERHAMLTAKSYKPTGRSRTPASIPVSYEDQDLQYCHQVSVVRLRRCTGITQRATQRSGLDCCAIKNITDCLQSVPNLERCLDAMQRNNAQMHQVVSLEVLHKLMANYLPCWRKQLHCEGPAKKHKWGPSLDEIDRLEYCNRMRLKETPKCLKTRSQFFSSESHCCTIKSVTRCLSESHGLRSCMNSLLNLSHGYPANTPEGLRLSTVELSLRLTAECEKSKEQCPEMEDNVSTDESVDVGSMVNDLYRRGKAGKKRIRPNDRPVTEPKTMAVDDVEREEIETNKYVPQKVKPTHGRPVAVTHELDVKNELPGPETYKGQINEACSQLHPSDLKKCVQSESRFMPETETDCCQIRNFTSCIYGLPRLRRCLDNLERHADSLEMDNDSELQLSSLKGLLPDFFFCWKKRPECKKVKVESNKKGEAEWTEQSSWSATINMLEQCNRLRLRETPYCERPGSYAQNIDCCTVKVVTQCLSNRAGLGECMRVLLSPPENREGTPEDQRLSIVKQSMRTMLECQRSNEQCPAGGVNSNADGGENELYVQNLEDDVPNREFVRPNIPRNEQEVVNRYQPVMNTEGVKKTQTVGGKEAPSTGVKCHIFTATATITFVRLFL